MGNEYIDGCMYMDGWGSLGCGGTGVPGSVDFWRAWLGPPVMEWGRDEERKGGEEGDWERQVGRGYGSRSGDFS